MCTLLSLTTLLSLIMPPGPGVTIDEYNRKQKARIQAQQSNMLKTGKPKTTQQAANSNSAPTKKRGNDKDVAEDAELKRRRVLAVSGAPPPDPDNDPQGGATEEDDDEPEHVKPKNPAWATAMWSLDAGASETTRIALGIQKPYKNFHGLVRTLTEYVDHTQILTYGINFHFEENTDRPGLVTPDCNDDVMAEVLWPQWLKFIPELKDHIDYLADNPPLIAIIGAYVTAIAYKVRSDDLGRLNDRIVTLCELEDPNSILVTKDNHGWQDSRTGCLLCPIRYLPKFEDNPARFCTHVRNRLVRMFSMDYPSFFYDMDLVDASDHKAGLLHGKALVNCYKSIFTGRSSVHNPNGHAARGQRSIACEYGITKVCLHSIIYVGLLACSALSDNEWSDTYGKFWKAENVVFSLMEIAFNFPEWYTDLICWWNRQVFGDDDELDSDAEDNLQGTAFYLIMAQKDQAETDPNNNNNNNNGDDDNDEAPAAGSSRANNGASK